MYHNQFPGPFFQIPGLRSLEPREGEPTQPNIAFFCGTIGSCWAFVGLIGKTWLFLPRL